MNAPELLFKVSNAFAGICWVLLLCLPRHSVTEKFVRSGAASFLLAMIYWLSLGSMLLGGGANEEASFNSIEGVRKCFASDFGLLAGWVHYLAFDLLIGVEMQKRLASTHVLWRFLCMFLIFTFGPVGWSLARVTLYVRARQN